MKLKKFKTFARMGGQPIQIDKAVSGLSFVLVKDEVVVVSHRHVKCDAMR